MNAVGGKVFSFRELEVYRRAVEEAGVVYRRSASFPADERYELTQQVRRSSSAVSPLIAEAWPKRAYVGVFAHTLRTAAGEVCETQAWLELASNRGHISPPEYEVMAARWEIINAMLYSLIAKRHKFPPMKSRK